MQQLLMHIYELSWWFVSDKLVKSYHLTILSSENLNNQYICSFLVGFTLSNQRRFVAKSRITSDKTSQS